MSASASYPALGPAFYSILVLYFLAMLVVGIWAGRRTKGTAGYFTGEGRVHHVLVGMSLLGTYLSALTMMALPRMSFGDDDWTWTVQLPFLLVTAVVITRWVLPRYREAGCISVYEFLERRIHVSARMIASLAFILLSIARMGLVLYLPSLALSQVTGLDLVTTIVGMGIVVTAYTALGGIRGVIVTDAVQVVIFVAGALATLFYVVVPHENFFAVANAHGKFRTLIPGADIARITTLWLVLETLIQTIRIYATQQDMTQRYMATESTRRANQSVWISILGYIPLGYLFYFIGTALYVYYATHPDPMVEQMRATGKLDALYAYFVVTRMPPPMAALVVSAFFAAAMSTISSSMNSSSAVCVEDFYKRFWRGEKSEAHTLRLAKVLTLLWGGLTIVMGLLLMQVEKAQVAWSKSMGISTCGILGLMALAFLPRRVSGTAASLGWLASVVSLLVMMFFLQIRPTVAWVWGIPKNCGVHFLLWPVVTNGVSFVAGLLLNRVFPPRSPAEAKA